MLGQGSGKGNAVATGSSTLVSVDSDGGLVLATLAGDGVAFAALYDRFAERVYDLHLALLRDPHQAALATYRTFRVAVADLNHLGNPTALRPWLYSHAYRQAGRGSKAVHGENLRWTAGLVAGPDPQAGMWQLLPISPSLKDVALITLHLRHGLSPSEIGSIIGSSAKYTQARLNRLNTDLEPALRTLLARQSPGYRPPSAGDIPDGGSTPGYPTEANPPPLRSAVPFAAPPTQLRDELIRDTPLISAHQGLPRPRTRAAWLTAALTVLVLVAGSVLFVHRSLERRPVSPVRFGPSSEFGLSTTMIDLGATASSTTVTLSNTGSNKLIWRAAPADPWLTISPASGTLSSGQSQALTVTANRDALPEGDGRTELQFISSNGQGEGDVSVALREERPPAIANPRASNTRIGGYGCPTTTQIQATVTDESQPIHVVLVGPGGQTQVMKAAGNTYTGKLGSGSHTSFIWRIIATDSRNNTATSPAQTVVYADCAARPVKPPAARPQHQPDHSQSARPQPSQSPSTQQEPGNGDDSGDATGNGASGDGSTGDDSTTSDTGNRSDHASTGDDGTRAGDTGNSGSRDTGGDTGSDTDNGSSSRDGGGGDDN